VARRKYDRWIRATAGNNADALAEQLFGFGADMDQAPFGEWSEIFHIPDCYRRQQFSGVGVTVMSTESVEEWIDEEARWAAGEYGGAGVSATDGPIRTGAPVSETSRIG
jgi:hypothetical protein